MANKKNRRKTSASRRVSGTKKRRTKYQILQKAASSYCNGKGSKSTVNKAKTAYVDDAVKKGKTKTEAERTASRVMSCSR